MALGLIVLIGFAVLLTFVGFFTQIGRLLANLPVWFFSGGIAKVLWRVLVLWFLLWCFFGTGDPTVV